MYAAKRGGKGCYQLFDEKLESSAPPREDPRAGDEADRLTWFVRGEEQRQQIGRCCSPETTRSRPSSSRSSTCARAPSSATRRCRASTTRSADRRTRGSPRLLAAGSARSSRRGRSRSRSRRRRSPGRDLRLAQPQPVVAAGRAGRAGTAGRPLGDRHRDHRERAAVRRRAARALDRRAAHARRADRDRRRGRRLRRSQAPDAAAARHRQARSRSRRRHLRATPRSRR